MPGERYFGGEVLPRQDGPGLKEFVFSDYVDQIWVVYLVFPEPEVGLELVMVQPFEAGPDPTQDFGVPVVALMPMPFTYTARSVRVFVPESPSLALQGVFVWGFRLDRTAADA